MKFRVFWDVITHRLLSGHRHSGGTCCLHSRVYAIHPSWAAISSKVEADFSSETSAILYQSTGYDITFQKNLIFNHTAAGT
jgi:hypothetical protein